MPLGTTRAKLTAINEEEIKITLINTMLCKARLMCRLLQQRNTVSYASHLCEGQTIKKTCETL